MAGTGPAMTREGKATQGYPWLWVAPALLPVLVFTLYPVGQAVWTSLHNVQLLFPAVTWAGGDNYLRVVASDYFLTALWNSLKMVLVAAPAVVVLGTLIALLLTRSFFGRSVVRAVILLPWALPGAITAVLWVWVFNPSWGVLNGILRWLGLIDSSIPWLTDPNLAFVSVATAHIWAQIPFSVVLVMAALATLSRETLEAATVDGANALQRFGYVIFPQIRAIVAVLLVYNALTAFTTYDVVYAMTGGGPGTATTLLSFQIWRESFSMYDFGTGSAVAFIVVAISGLLIFAIMKALPSDMLAKD
jgi:multiple sugar transport system permease protein